MKFIYFLIISLLFPYFIFSQGNTCATATTLTPAASCTYTSGTTVAATYQSNAANGGVPGCASPGAPDVWYSFTTTTAGTYTIDTQTGTITDSGMSLYSGTCGSLTEVACDDDGSANGAMSMISTALAATTTYYIRVWAYGGSTTGTFGICITSPPVLPPGSIVMTNGSTSACSGTFYDPGGLSNYSNSIAGMVFTICPTIAGNKVQATFTAFATENALDFLEIFDGNSVAAPSLGTYTGTTSPGIAQATNTNASGCLTFRFTSDGSVNNTGWLATLACIAPCQTITANLVSSTEAAGAGGIVRICNNQSVNFVGSGTFSSSSIGATYAWTFGDGTTANGANVNHTYSSIGSYYVNLTITDPAGCKNSNLINLNVQVSTTPTIATSATPSTICTNQTSALAANVTMNNYTQNCTPPVSGTTFLPDGSGVSYNTSIMVNCFNSAATVTTATDINNVCMTMEHSYLGDLNIRLICPNGQSMVLKSYAQGGGSLYLGAAIDDVISGPGTGTNYCFTPSAVTPLVSGGTTSIGTPASASVVAGNYAPQQPFTNLIGCPLNGSWTIEITDNLASDDGYIFNWDVNFSSLLTAAPSFTPSIVSQGWIAAPTLTSTGLTTANVVPTAIGTPCFTYQVVDNFGCTYTQPQCITVNCTALPVGLVGYDVNLINGKIVLNEWVTSSEFTNSYFKIQRSVDFISWETIGTTPGKGNADFLNNYDFIDEQPFVGTSYYRLTQVDLNGDEVIYDPKSVEINASFDGEIVAYPNPTSGKVLISGIEVSKSEIELYNAEGKKIALTQIIEKENGDFELNLEHLNKGIYLLKAGDKSISLTKF